MAALVKPVIYFAGFAFLAAVVTSFIGPVANLPAEAFSRACSNLALIAIALVMAERGVSAST